MQLTKGRIMYKIAICDDDKRYRKTIREIVEHENTSMFAAPHVRRELKRIAKMDNPPKEKTVIWY